jgi:CubicO group peptidase (beta-lactamase class C family)
LLIGFSFQGVGVVSRYAQSGVALFCALAVPFLGSCGPPRGSSDPARTQQAALATIEQDIRVGRFGNVHAVVVRQRGAGLAEWYFEGTDELRGRQLGNVVFDADTLHDLRSVTKSVVSVLFGIALADGAIASVDEKVIDYFPDYADLVTPPLSQIRLRDLLSMTSGLRWDERTYPYTDVRNSETGMDLAADRVRFILSSPVEAAPGERFNYSGGDVELVATIVARATQTPLAAYAKDKLFQPLAIDVFEWLEYTSGGPIAASGLRLRPRDMAKIGELMRQGGRWEGHQVVPRDWVEMSTAFQAQISPDRRCGVQYGYFWWLGAICDGDRRIAFVEANGNGGQRIRLVPDPDVVIVTTAGFYNRGDRSIDEVASRLLSALSVAANR